MPPFYSFGELFQNQLFSEKPFLGSLSESLSNQETNHNLVLSRIQQIRSKIDHLEKSLRKKSKNNSPDIRCSISIENDLKSEENVMDCECNNQLEIYSPKEILSIFCELFPVKLCNVQYDLDSKTLKMNYFGAQNQGENYFILELASFPLHFFQNEESLKSVLRKQTRKNTNLKFIFEIKNLLQRFRNLINNKENYIYYELKKNCFRKNKGMANKIS